MKLFIYEHITSGALANEVLPSSLSHEGDLMLQAALADAVRCDDIKVTTLRDSRLSPVNLSNNISTHIIRDAADVTAAFAVALAAADAALLIAPDPLLIKLNQQVLDAGKTLLGCSPTAVATASDKYQCSQQLAKQGVATPTEQVADCWQADDFAAPTGYIIKPISGVGCEATQWLADTAAVSCWRDTQPVNSLKSWLIQAYYRGTTASLTVLCDRGSATVLTINQQQIQRQEGMLIFTGCTLNSNCLSHDSATDIAEQVHQAITGLWGIIGIDIICTDNALVVVDVNPRLTTSYAALHEATGLNPMQLLCDMAQSGQQKSYELPRQNSRQPVTITL